ncbi:DUF4386 domain-containing protein [Actinomadura verrucosospora]|uniref:DUF4386 domain-containing protein n=1 Tax=Actinomadura verrucosospora TaxID=46165 RepID=A0A7D4A2Z7_ACTVE|nr:DUF4386 domain-containing protein [Actinomadura verrucosospora]QKG21245.1 hypothetical protein ACTIVE_2883 [Actinomadura verrucosospora]
MTTQTAARAAGSGRRPQSGPPLLLPVLVFAALTIAYVVANRSMPHPDASGAEVLRYAREHGTAIKAGTFLLLGSAFPLTVAACVLYRRLRALGITAPGSAITLAGGMLAAGMLALSAMFGWAGGRLPADASPALARALADLSFLAGGPAYAATFALLVAGLAVTGLLARLLPRPMAWIGLAIALAGMVATLTLVGSGFAVLAPVVRFGGLLWLVAAAALLPRTRHEVRARDGAATA